LAEIILKQRMNDLRLNPVDLRNHIRLGVHHVYHGAVNRSRGFLPLVTFELLKHPIHVCHLWWGTPHMVGRYLDALAVASEVIEFSEDREADEALAGFIFDCLDNEMNLPIHNFGDEQGRPLAWMHNCREVLLALTGLWRWKKNEKALDTAKKFVRTLERVTRETGSFPGSECMAETGWGGEMTDYPNTHSGRLVGALVRYYRATEDDLAIDLAKRLADFNIAKAFTPEGELTERAGTHLHSTEGTVTGILDLGMVTNDRRYLEIGKLVFDRGLRPWRTSFGWAKENRTVDPGRGEANNTGDFIQSALILGQMGFPEYFQIAEKMIRNGLLGAQIVNTDWIPESPDPPPDTPDIFYRREEICRRAMGAFAFTTPNAYHSLNTDLIGGAIQSLCDAYKTSVTTNGNTVQVNLLFTAESPHVSVKSLLPAKGSVTVFMKQAGTLSVFFPTAEGNSDVTAFVNDQRIPVVRQGQYVLFDDLKKESKAHLHFKPVTKQTQEKATGYNQPFDINWRGDTIMDMSPSPEIGSLY
jgi:hypothetical protein